MKKVKNIFICFYYILILTGCRSNFGILENAGNDRVITKLKKINFQKYYGKRVETLSENERRVLLNYHGIFAKYDGCYFTKTYVFIGRTSKVTLDIVALVRREITDADGKPYICNKWISTDSVSYISSIRLIETKVYEAKREKIK
ncbi:MAG: hypothetical protein RL757_3082 [Bacteroidota bacterium]|jgi:hypothetical protein